MGQAGGQAGTLPPAGHRALFRLLRALLQAPAQVEPSGSAAVDVEAGGVRRTVRLPATAVADAQAVDLARRDGQMLVLTAEGRAWIMREQEVGAPLLAQHRPLRRDTVEVNGQAADVLVDEAESPLAWLRRRRGRNGSALIDEAAFAAGERLRADFTRGNMAPRVTANWQAAATSGRRSSGADVSYSDVVVAARQRVQAAMTAVGPELSGVVMDVCCFLKGLEEVERERGWPVRSGKVVLTLALDRLARHYGLSSRAQGPNRSSMRHWGADDYRPHFPAG